MLESIPYNLFYGILLAMSANVILGSIDSIIKKKFDKAKLIEGITKALLVLFSLSLFYIAGHLNPEIKVIDELTIPIIIETTGIATFIFYSAQGLLKIKEIVLPSVKQK
jgi:ABC-type uncharacterized transport system permease subunit